MKYKYSHLKVFQRLEVLCLACLLFVFVIQSELYFLRKCRHVTLDGIKASCWESGSHITCHPAKPTVSVFIQVAKCVPCIFPLFELYFLRPDITCHQEPPRGAVGKICVRQNVTEFIHRSGKKKTPECSRTDDYCCGAWEKIYNIQCNKMESKSIWIEINSGR